MKTDFHEIHLMQTVSETCSVSAAFIVIIISHLTSNITLFSLFLLAPLIVVCVCVLFFQTVLLLFFFTLRFVAVVVVVAVVLIHSFDNFLSVFLMCLGYFYLYIFSLLMGTIGIVRTNELCAPLFSIHVGIRWLVEHQHQ